MIKDEKKIRRGLCILPAVNLLLLPLLLINTQPWLVDAMSIFAKNTEAINFLSMIGAGSAAAFLVLFLTGSFFLKWFFCINQTLRLIAGCFFLYELIPYAFRALGFTSFYTWLILIAGIMMILPMPLYIILMNKARKRELQRSIERIQEESGNRTESVDLDDD